MEQVLSILPVLYIYWACGLIVWSTIVCGMQALVLNHNRQRNQSCRRADIVMLFMVGLCGLFLGVSVFIIPQITALFVEIALLVVLWYTVFLVALNHLNVQCFIARY